MPQHAIGQRLPFVGLCETPRSSVGVADIPGVANGDETALAAAQVVELSASVVHDRRGCRTIRRLPMGDIP